MKNKKLHNPNAVIVGVAYSNDSFALINIEKNEVLDFYFIIIDNHY